MKKILGKFILLSSLSVISFNAYSQWNCYSADQSGHNWMSSGLTEESAGVVALNFCAAFSPNAESCHKTKCFEK